MFTQRPVRWLFLVALFVIAKNRKQVIFPTIGGWLKKLCSHNVMEDYSAIKRNKLLIHQELWCMPRALCWVKKKPISRGGMLCDSIYIVVLEGQNYRGEGQISDCWGLGMLGRWGWFYVTIKRNKRDLFVRTE